MLKCVAYDIEATDSDYHWFIRDLKIKEESMIYHFINPLKKQTPLFIATIFTKLEKSLDIGLYNSMFLFILFMVEIFWMLFIIKAKPMKNRFMNSIEIINNLSLILLIPLLYVILVHEDTSLKTYSLYYQLLNVIMFPLSYVYAISDAIFRKIRRKIKREPKIQSTLFYKQIIDDDEE